MTCPKSHRHGETLNCYNRHRCRCVDCRAARSDRVPYERRTRGLEGKNVWTSATSTMRKLQALAVVGWSLTDIVEHTGAHPRHLVKIRQGEMVNVRIATAKRVEKAYRDLAMHPKNDRAAKITKTIARQNGWVSAFAWDDIEKDSSPADVNQSKCLDEVRIWQIINGGNLSMTRDERQECVRILHARRWTDARIAEHIRCAERTVERIRGRLGLEAYPYHELIKRGEVA